MENKRFFVTVLAVMICMSLAAVDLSAEIWTPIQTQPPLDEHQFGVTYGDSTWVIVGDTVGDGGLVKTSPDGVHWTKRTSGVAQSLNGVAYSNGLGLFAAVGHCGTIITSPDGITWTRKYPNPETTENFQCICCGVINGTDLFIAAGNNGTIYTSSNGITWLKRTSGVNNRLDGICCSAVKGLFVIVGYDGVILTSDDGIGWDNHSLSMTNYLFDVVYGDDDGLFVATSKNGTLFISDSGFNWSKRNPGIMTEHLYGITYGNSEFIAVGNFGACISSLDGRNWVLEINPPLTTEPLWDIAYDANMNRFVAVGQNIILYSTPGD
jgi:photosystem II stability/assembly factor-like uncharacterized protein